MRNKYHVPKRQWARWHPVAQRIFNEMNFLMLRGQGFFSHPKAVVQKKEHWKTTCWNAAWMAAENATTALG